MSILREIKLINSDVDSNHNKYWNAILHDDGKIDVEYGRVGYSGQTETYDSSRGGERFLEKKIKEKIKKGYHELKVIKDNISSVSIQKKDLKEIVKQKVSSQNSELDKLVELLIETNIHNIVSTTNISYDKNSNLFTTPLGIITLDSITEARSLLDNLFNKIVVKDVNQYLRLVPQSFGMKKFDISVFSDKNFIKKQSDILDSLEISWNTITKTPLPDSTKKQEDSLLDIALDILDNSSPEYNRINTKFEKTKKHEHHSSKHLKIKKIYTIQLNKMKKSFSECNINPSNIMELWHGSNVANILSILNSGLKISPPSTANITGKLFGNGAYFSSDSTKSLNYSCGYWSKSKVNNVFLFVADIEMGNVYIPKYGESLPKCGKYHSCWAKPNISGILNDEMIVYKENQINLKYLIECY